MPAGTPAESPRPRDPNRPLRMFISYRREDSSGQAGRLYDSLSEHFGSENVFMDLDTIGPGEDFVEVIDDALQNCDCVLVVIGPRWLRAEREGQRRLDDPADYLRIEVEHSLARAARVIPVLVQDADMPGSRELPEAIRTLARRNAFDLSDSRWRLDVQRLIDALEDIAITLGIGRAAAPSPPPAMTPPPAISGPSWTPPTPITPQVRAPVALPPAIVLPPWVAQRIGPIAAVLALVVVVALGAYFLAKGGGPGPTLPAPTSIAVASGTPGGTAAAITPTPTQVPTSAPAATPQPSATGAGASAEPQTPPPTSGPTAQPTPVRVVPPGIGLGASSPEMDETFTTPGSFAVTSDERGSLAYAGGGFEITVSSTNYYLWSPHILPGGHAVLRARASITVGTDEANGSLMCGNGSPDYLYGAVGRANQWVIGSIIANSIQVIESGTIPVAAQVKPGKALDVRLECAVTGASTDRVQLIIGGIKVADTSTAPRVGPFSAVALMASSGTITPAASHFDNLSVWSGATFREATENLRDHIPSTFATQCNPTQENGAAGQVAALMCKPAGDIEQAEYYAFDTEALMTKEFADTLGTSGTSATGKDCAVGPSTLRYNDVTNKDAGTVACFPNPGDSGGLLILWTNETLDILSAGIDVGGTYAGLNTWWIHAGPLP
jgi:TIR domain